MTPRSVIYFGLLLDIIDIVGICLVLIGAFAIQVLYNELPCPLCLLQRLGVLAIAAGPVMNLRYNIKPLHYGMSILAAVFTMLVALRQISLHVLPGTGAYGMAFLGLHLYVWVFIMALSAIIYFTLAMSVSSVFLPYDDSELRSQAFQRLSYFAFGLLIIMVAANAVSTFIECGLQQCPDNPHHYLAGL